MVHVIGPDPRLQRVYFCLIELNAAICAAAFGNGFCQKGNGRVDALVFGIVAEAHDFQALFLIGLTRCHVATFDIAARTGYMRPISGAQARLAFDAVPVPGQP